MIRIFVNQNVLEHINFEGLTCSLADVNFSSECSSYWLLSSKQCTTTICKIVIILYTVYQKGKEPLEIDHIFMI